MLYYLIWAFALFTIILMPTFFFYASGAAYGDQDKLGYAPRTIGALGYSEYKCMSIPQWIGSTGFSLSCDYGIIGEVTYYGVNPPNAHGSCMENT